MRRIFSQPFCDGYHQNGSSFSRGPQCLKITEKVSFNIASEASYILHFKRIKSEAWGQKVLPEVPILNGQKCWKIQNWNATFKVIFKQCVGQTRIFFAVVNSTLIQNDVSFTFDPFSDICINSASTKNTRKIRRYHWYTMCFQRTSLQIRVMYCTLLQNPK